MSYVWVFECTKQVFSSFFFRAVQQIAFKNLVQRNKQLEKLNGSLANSAIIQLPFIIVNTSKKTVIDCSISSDK